MKGQKYLDDGMCYDIGQYSGWSDLIQLIDWNGKLIILNIIQHAQA